jgi:REP element-mobilizing transposase RayT
MTFLDRRDRHVVSALHVHLVVVTIPSVAADSALMNSLTRPRAQRLRPTFTGPVNRHIRHSHFWPRPASSHPAAGLR